MSVARLSPGCAPRTSILFVTAKIQRAIISLSITKDPKSEEQCKVNEAIEQLENLHQ